MKFNSNILTNKNNYQIKFLIKYNNITYKKINQYKKQKYKLNIKF